MTAPLSLYSWLSPVLRHGMRKRPPRLKRGTARGVERHLGIGAVRGRLSPRHTRRVMEFEKIECRLFACVK